MPPVKRSAPGMAISDLPGSGKSSRTSKGQTISLGRGSVCTRQAAVVLTCDSSSDLHNRSRKRSETVAPYSDDKYVHQIVRGDPVFGRVNSASRLGPSRSVSGAPALTVFAALNGLKYNDRVIFVGIADNPGDTESEENSGLVANNIRIAGTTTVVNTGPDYICAGQPVYISEFPYIEKDASGAEMPGVSMTRIGVPAQKYVGAFFSMTSPVVGEQTQWLSESIRSLFESRFDFDSSESLSFAVKSILEQHKIRQCMPLWHFGYLVAARLAVKHALYRLLGQEFDNALRQFVIPFTVDAYNKYHKDITQNRERYLLGVGESSTRAVHIDKDAFSMGVPLAQVGDRIQAYQSFFAEVVDALDADISRCELHQIDYLQGKYVGLCLTNSSAGAPMDLLLRHGKAT